MDFLNLNFKFTKKTWTLSSNMSVFQGVIYRHRFSFFKKKNGGSSVAFVNRKMVKTENDRCQCQKRKHLPQHGACSVGWWLMAGAGLFWEKSTAGWLRLVAGGWFVLREKYCWLVADKPSEQADEVFITFSIVLSPVTKCRCQRITCSRLTDHLLCFAWNYQIRLSESLIMADDYSFFFEQRQMTK
jgi:hypothetical protein